MFIGGICKTTLQPRMQVNNIIRSSPNKVLSLHVCVSFHDSAAAWHTQLLFAKWSSRMPWPCWHIMTNVWTLAEKPAMISKILSEIMVAEGGVNVSANYSKGNRLVEKKKKKIKNSLVDDNTLCCCDRDPHFSIHLSTYSIKHTVSSKRKRAAEWH